MRLANLLFCCLFLALTFVGSSTALHATDLRPPREAYPDDRQRASKAPSTDEIADYCFEQRQICRKICRLNERFNDRFDGCPHSCDSRETRCVATACFRWTDPDYIIAEKFGGDKCFRR